MKNYDVGDRKFDWPNNMISTQCVVYGDGKIRRKGDEVSFFVDPEELCLCQKLSSEAHRSNPRAYFDFGSAETNRVWPFFVCSNVEKRAPKQITEELIWQSFGGTIFPLATITVEALNEEGIWWEEAERDIEGDPDFDLLMEPYRELCRWFHSQKAFVSTAFVRIGDSRLMMDLRRNEYPDGTRMVPSHLPRLALGLTKQGSLVGVMGHTVHA